MKAIVCTKYGPPEVFQLKEVAKPAPKYDEVLVKISAAYVNARDWRMMRANPFVFRLKFRIRKPKNLILGADMAGRVEAVGNKVEQFQVGDDVFGCLSRYHGRTFAEYACAVLKLLAPPRRREPGTCHDHPWISSNDPHDKILAIRQVCPK